MITIHSDICPICEGADLKSTLSCKDNFASKDYFSVCICQQCGFGFTQDFPAEDEIAPYYDVPEYISHTDSQTGIVNNLYHWARKIALKSKTNIVLNYSIKKRGTLLDLGAGTGYFLKSMKDLNWQVTGIEKSPSARLYAHQRFGIDCQDENQLFDLAPKSFDSITMWHVLEHIEKLDETVNQLHEILKDDGTLIIALPNKKSYDALAYKENWAAYDVPRHLWHFSPSDFDLLAKKHQFKLVKMKPMYFDATYISMLSEKNKGTSCANLVGLAKGLIFTMRSLFHTEKCSSIVYILRKNNI